MQRDDGGRRYFVLTAGRTGSTLLAAILADAGAEFGMEPPKAWDPGTGAMEGTDLRRACKWLRYAHQISPERPTIGVQRCLWSIFRSLGKMRVRRLLKNTRYVKGGDTHLIVNPAFRQGFLPTVIISYRRFEESAVSFAPMRGHTTLESLVESYTQTNRNALLWLNSFGGCVIGYEQLTDPDDTSWVAPLAAVTNLDAERLLESRKRRVRNEPRAAEFPSLDSSAKQIFESIDALRGCVIPPSAAVLRAHSARLRQSGPADGVPSHQPQPSAWQWLHRLGVQAAALGVALIDPRVPWYPRIVALACILAYIFAPIDPIPNKLPIIGHLDDAILVALAIALFIRLIPGAIKLEHRAAATAWLARK